MKRRYRIGLVAACMLTACAAGGLVLIKHGINNDVQKWSSTALAAYPDSGDKLTAMLLFLQSEEHSLNDRNHMIWAIGQSRNAEALPILGTFYTGQECNHSETLCQHELEKAIRLCDR